ncbi:glycosyltransferase family 39 protein, partial [Myxococcota bacterium]|nr:glycosyltransferase family 39 protein [Myxococcota bacterium]
SEASARLPSIVLSLFSLLLLYGLVRRRYGPGAALLAGLCFTMAPMMIEYGSMANYEPPIIAFALLALWFLDRLRYENGRAGSMVGLVAALLLAGFTDWPGFILAAFIGLDAVIRPPRKPLAFVLIGVFTALLLVGLWYWLNAWSEHDGLAGLARYRAGLGAIKVTYAALFGRTMDRIVVYYGLLIAVPALLFVLWDLVRNFRMDPVVFVFFFSTVLYFLAFRAGAFIHSFFLHYLTVALAVAAGVGLWKGGEFLWGLAKRLPPIPTGSPMLKLAPLKRPLLVVALTLVILPLVSYQWGLVVKAKNLSYGIRGRVKRGAPLPRRGRLDVVLLARTIRSITRNNELVMVHPRSFSSPQFRYYVNRRTLRSANPAYFKQAAVYLVPERLLNEARVAEFVRSHQVIQTMGYLLINFRNMGPNFTRLDFVTYPGTWTWTLLHSSFYPPHRLVANTKASREFLERRKIKAPPKPPRGRK